MTIDPLAVDIYPFDFNGKPNISAFVAAGPPWHVLLLKASEGTYYPRNNPDAKRWFLSNWRLVPYFGPERYGKDLWRGAYHYFRADEDPIGQADNFLSTVELAGGWGYGDLQPMVDVERAEQPAGVSKAQVIDGVSRWSAKITSALGVTPILYTGEYCRGLGITDHMGCGMLVTAAYGATLPERIYTELGWQITDAMPTVLGWQYEGAGDPPSGPEGYPRSCPLGDGTADITALIVAGGGDKALEFLRGNVGC